jgi:hypothetical protein
MSEYRNVRSHLYDAEHRLSDVQSHLAEAEMYMESYPTIEWGQVPKLIMYLIGSLGECEEALSQLQRELVKAQNGE